MKVSDLIVLFLVEKGITDVFGYPGGMVTHLMDSLQRHSDKIRSHVCYHEQGASFAACGYGQVAHKPGVAFATSGPGATNLITGIANAYFDSIPTLFITGQVNVYEGRGTLPMRQKGFQEMDVVSLVGGITKYCVSVEDEADILFHLEKAWCLAMEGRPGPVLLDIPMNVQRSEVTVSSLRRFFQNPPERMESASTVCRAINCALENAKHPCILAGAGINASAMRSLFAQWINQTHIPVVSSMLAVDVLPQSADYYGFIGAYGGRAANFILAKSDLIISLGSRLDLRQTGSDKSKFAPYAKLIRIDVDSDEITHRIKEDEMAFRINIKELMPVLVKTTCAVSFKQWHNICNELKIRLEGLDEQPANTIIKMISSNIPPDTIITTDVGQNQVWVAQSFEVRGQRILFSGGHGAMGYSVPAAIGAYYASRKPVIAFCGDGGLQMNIQELAFIAREKLPICIILLNNASLGMIRHFQEMYFNNVFTQTKKEGGYTIPDFSILSGAYGIDYSCIDAVSFSSYCFDFSSPSLLEVVLSDTTYVYPKLAMGKSNEDQEPPIDRELFSYLAKL